MITIIKLIFISAIICALSGFIIRLLAKKNWIVKDNPVSKENLINLGDKLMFYATIVFVVGAIYTLLNK